MKDPFEEFLEDAMSGPDLELGHEMRRRLLEAAVAGETQPADNVVQISRPEPGEQEGFDWIVGETEASTPLMNRMIGDPDFLEELDQNRSFLTLLRAALRKQVAAEAPAAGRGKRLGSALAISAAAALALAAGTIFFQPAGRQTAPEVAQADAPAREEAISESPAPAPAPAPAIAEAPAPAPAVAKTETVQPTEVAVMEVAPQEETPAAPVVEPVLPMPSPAVAEESGKAIAMVGGSGQSIAPDDPLLAVAKPAAALQLAAAELAAEEEADFALVQTSTSHSRMDGFWHEDRFGGGGGFGSYFASTKRNGNTVGTGPAEEDGDGLGDGDDSLSIPEPGVALPVVFGMMALLMRRKRREEEEAAN